MGDSGAFEVVSDHLHDEDTDVVDDDDDVNDIMTLRTTTTRTVTMTMAVYRRDSLLFSRNLYGYSTVSFWSSNLCKSENNLWMMCRRCLDIV